MIKMIAFDCWGTLFASSQRPHPFAVFASRIGHKLTDRVFLELFEQILMTQEYPDLKVPIRELLDRLHIAARAELVDDLDQILLGSIAAQIVFPETLEILHDLSKRYRLAMITNSFRQGFEALLLKFPVRDDFEIILSSYKQHVIKPDPAMFSSLLQSSKLLANEVIFVGDSLESDIEPAEAIGMKGILIDRRDRYPGVAGKIRDLRELESVLAE